MRLDYISDLNEYGDKIVRLYGFDRSQADKFRNILKQVIIINKTNLDLATIDFIEARNCNLILRIANEDLGITTDDEKNFLCELTIEGFSAMISLLEPFCKKETKGYQWLYDIDSSIDFLFSPAGTW